MTVEDGGMGPWSARNDGRGALLGLAEKNRRLFLGEALQMPRLS